VAAHPDLQAEQAFVDQAHERLETMRIEAARMMDGVLDLGKGGTFQSRTERDIVVRTSLARLQQLDIGDQALCFGRIDRGAEDGQPVETFHIGRLAVSGADHDPLVVDWRAPVAEPFYRATGQDPQGLVRRRHLAVEGRRVTGVEDELFGPADQRSGVRPGGSADTWRHPVDGFEQQGGPVDGDELYLGGPGALLSALDRARSGQMRDIVATIQAEQDEIIRAPLAGVLVVQGGPGTGKTAVALHRAAYLLYTHRFPLERQGVLVVGPNPLFLRYIEQVLPSLGESGVTLSTIGGLVSEIKVRATEPSTVATIKGEVRMATVLARAVRTRQRPLRRNVEVPFGATVLRLTADESANIVASARRRSGTHNARRRWVERTVVELLVERYRQAQESLVAARDAAGADEEDELDDGALFASEVNGGEIGRQLRRTPEVDDALHRMWPRLSPHELLHDLFGAAPLLEAAGRGILTQSEQAILCRTRSASLDEVPWTAADVALVDEARTLLGPRSTGRDDWSRSYGHIVVDEVQDLSPLQLRMLERRSLSGSMTVVGDIAQATGPWAPRSWDDVTAHLPSRRPPIRVELTVGYRTPAEVVDVAARLLPLAAPGLRAPRTVRRTGVLPVATGVDAALLSERAVMSAAAELATVGPGRVAILGPPELLDDIVAVGRRRDVAAVDPREAGRGGLTAPLVILPAAEANGLEFDAVVVVEPAAIVEAAGAEGRGLRTLYVALTRTTRRLIVVHARPLPAPLADASLWGDAVEDAGQGRAVHPLDASVRPAEHPAGPAPSGTMPGLPSSAPTDDPSLPLRDRAGAEA